MAKLQPPPPTETSNPATWPENSIQVALICVDHTYGSDGDYDVGKYITEWTSVTQEELIVLRQLSENRYDRPYGFRWKLILKPDPNHFSVQDVLKRYREEQEAVRKQHEAYEKQRKAQEAKYAVEKAHKANLRKKIQAEKLAKELGIALDSMPGYNDVVKSINKYNETKEIQIEMKTEIIAILDASGSMQGLKKDTIGGFNAFLNEQKEVEGEARITTVTFDSFVKPPVHNATPIKSAYELSEETYRIGGSTALYDAIGQTLETQGARIAREKWAEMVIVVITTDGQENSSRTYDQRRIQQMIEHAQGKGWKFLFTAANQDAFAAAQSLGISAQTTAAFNASAGGEFAKYRAYSMASKSLRSSGAMGQSLSASYDSFANPEDKVGPVVDLNATSAAQNPAATTTTVSSTTPTP